MSLTAAGEELRALIEEPLEAIGQAAENLNRFRDTPGGRVRINILEDAASLLLGPVMPAFIERYPGVEVDISVNNRLIDVIGSGFDAGIRYGGTVPEDMIAQRLSSDIRWVAAALSTRTLAAVGCAIGSLQQLLPTSWLKADKRIFRLSHEWRWGLMPEGHLSHCCEGRLENGAPKGEFWGCFRAVESLKAELYATIRAVISKAWRRRLQFFKALTLNRKRSGGGRSPQRTALSSKFPAYRENNRDSATSCGQIGYLDPNSADLRWLYTEIPYVIEQGIGHSQTGNVEPPKYSSLSPTRQPPESQAR